MPLFLQAMSSPNVYYTQFYTVLTNHYTVKKMEFYNPGSGINIHFRIVNILSFPFSNFTKRELNFPKRFSK